MLSWSIIFSSDKTRSLPKKTFCFDIDDVIGWFMEEITRYFSNNPEYNNIEFWLDDVNTYDFQTIFWKPLTTDEIKVAAYETEVYSKMRINNGVKTFINGIKDEYRIVFITSRYPWTEEITQKWFEDNNLFYDIIFYQPYKSWLIPFLNADYLVDDSLENIIKVSKNTNTKGILFNKPWNWEDEENRLIKSWKLTRDQIDKELNEVIFINSMVDLTKMWF